MRVVSSSTSGTVSRRSRRVVVLIACAVALGGCAEFTPKPIVPMQVLQDLQRVHLDAAGPPLAGGSTEGVPSLSAEDAVAAALTLSPTLRAFRLERGVAEGEIVAAGVLQNPALSVTWFGIEHFTKSIATSGWDVALQWSPPRPGEISTKRAQARARLATVRAQIADEEWRLAADVRKAHAALWAAQERRRLADASLALQQRVRRFVRDKLDLGDASRLEANLIELEYVETRREQEKILADEAASRLALNGLLGIPPRAVLAVHAPDGFAYRGLALSPPALERVMVERRADLAAAREEYEQAQQALRLAYVRRIPWLSFGPAYSRDGSAEEGSVNKIGLGVTFDIPLANLNKGELLRLDATRDRLRETFVARVHGARNEVAEALNALRAQERLVRLFEDTVRPALEENARLTDAAIETGDINVLQFVAAQGRALRARREGIDARLDYWKAVFDLERSIGARVDVVEHRED